MNAYTSRLGGLTGYYAAQIIAGVGAVYGTCLGNALKWFPDKRGLAAGITAAGFGMDSAFTVVPIQNMIQGKPASGSELRRPTATGLRRLIYGSPQPIEGSRLSKMAQVPRRVYGR